MTLILIIAACVLTILKACADGFRWNHKMKPHHAFQVLTWLVFGVIIYVVNFNPVSSVEFWRLFTLALTFRFFAYDYIIILVSGKYKKLGIDYIGEPGSSIYVDLFYWFERV